MPAEAVDPDVREAADDAYKLAVELWALKARPRLVWLAKCSAPTAGDDRRLFTEGPPDLRGRYHPFGQPPFRGEILVVADQDAHEAALTIGHEVRHARQVERGELPQFRALLTPAVVREAELDAEAAGRVVAGHIKRGMRAAPQPVAREDRLATLSRQIEAKLDRLLSVCRER